MLSVPNFASNFQTGEAETLPAELKIDAPRPPRVGWPHNSLTPPPQSVKSKIYNHRLYFLTFISCRPVLAVILGLTRPSFRQHQKVQQHILIYQRQRSTYIRQLNRLKGEREIRQKVPLQRYSCGALIYIFTQYEIVHKVHSKNSRKKY